jgi:ParB family chromosome partitioning protein
MEIGHEVRMIDPESVDITGDWLFWAEEPDERYVTSIFRLGQAAPALMAFEGGQPVLVAGYKRALACRGMSRGLAALEFKGGARERGLAYLADNAGRDLTPGMRLKALRYFDKLYSAVQAREAVLPHLALDERSREWELLRKWLLLPSTWDDFLFRGRLPLEAAKYLARMKDNELAALSPFFELLGFSRSNALNFLTWLYEAGRSAGSDVGDIIEKQDFFAVLESELSPADKLTRIMGRAREIRFPELSVLERGFAAAAEELAAGTVWRVEPSKSFESAAVTVSAQLRDRESLDRALEDLDRMRGSALWEKLWETGEG